MAFLSSFYPQPVVAGTTAGTYAAGNDARFGDGLAEAPEDGIIYGRKDADWVDITEPANLQIRRGTAAEVNAITPLEGEPVWETDAKKLVVGDGTTAGGIVVGKFPLDGTLRNVSSPNSPVAGSIFVSEEVDNRGGTGLGRPYVAGNARGGGAVDLQAQRIVATQVASGPNSFIASSTSATASGTRSCVISSSNATASGSQGVAMCGDAHIVSGIFAFGVNSNVSVDYAAAFYGTADRFGMLAHGSRGTVTGFSSTERAQSVEFVLKGRTINATPTVLILNTLTYLTIPQNVSLFGTIDICAIEETNATEAAHFIRKFAIQNLGGTTTLIGSVTDVGTDYESDAGYAVSITADDASDYLKIEVTGDSAKTLRWVAVVRGTEIDIV